MEGAATAGSSMLTESPPPPIPAANGAAANGGTPAKLDGAQQAVADAQAAPPEWAPAKYWDSKTKQVRVEELGKGYINLERLVGRDKIPMPAGEDDEEGWQRVYGALRPEAPDKYEFKRPEKLPDGLSYDEDLEKDFRTWAHVNGLSKRQANSMYDGWVKRQIDRHAAWHTTQQQTKSQAEQALRREYGQQYDGALTGAKQAIVQYTDPDFRSWLDETGLGNDPRMIRVFARIGKEMGGETRLQGKPAPAANPADLDRAIAEFRSKHQDALYKREHPDHDLRVREYNRLFEARYGEQ